MLGPPPALVASLPGGGHVSLTGIEGGKSKSRDTSRAVRGEVLTSQTAQGLPRCFLKGQLQVLRWRQNFGTSRSEE